MTTTHHRHSVAGDERERQALEQLEALLSSHDATKATIWLGAHGREVVLPESIVALLRQSVHALAQHKVVAIVPRNRELTTQEAADILNVSRPYVIRLLDQGLIPYTRTGTHRRIRFDDVTRYKAERDAVREKALDELAQLNQEMGLYDTQE